MDSVELWYGVVQERVVDVVITWAERVEIYWCLERRDAMREQPSGLGILSVSTFDLNVDWE
jgi:hypothetical protein